MASKTKWLYRSDTQDYVERVGCAVQVARTMERTFWLPWTEATPQVLHTIGSLGISH